MTTGREATRSGARRARRAPKSAETMQCTRLAAQDQRVVAHKSAAHFRFLGETPAHIAEPVSPNALSQTKR